MELHTTAAALGSWALLKQINAAHSQPAGTGGKLVGEVPGGRAPGAWL
jgi:hypothetical protein